MGAWKVEFGKEAADKLRGWIDSAMADYSYLNSKRIGGVFL